MNNDKVDVRQYMLLVVLFTIGSSILFIPLSSAAAAKQSGWIAILIGMAVTIGLIRMYIALARLAPGCTLVDMNRKWLGKWLGSAVSIFYAGNSLLLAASSLIYYVGDFMTTKILTDTPISVINIMFALVVVMGLRMGLGTLGRAADVLFPVFAVLFAAMILFVAPEMKAENMQPVFASGAKQIAEAVFDYISFSGMPVIYFLMIYPSLVADSPKSAKAFYMGSVIGGSFLLIIAVAGVAVMGVEETVNHAYPSYALAKKINIGNFITRIEVIMATIWIISLYFKVIIYFYAGMKGFAQLLNIRNEKVLLLPLGMLMVVFSLIMYPSGVYRSWWDSKIWPPYAMTFGIFLPLLLLAIAKLSKSRNASG
ncbi:MAG: spore gernimation protein [Paenibacillus sp.]|jgi:spore germination protein KB|nr:spore gernimation protein [Paenibacillus sp.]